VLPLEYDDLSTSDDNLSRSESPTPQNSPHLNRSIISTESIQMQQQQQQQQQPQQSSTQTISKRSSGLSSQMTTKSSKEFSDSLENDSSNQSSPNSVYKEQPRVLFLETTKCANLGISLLGGNAYGIFVHSVQKESMADNAGMRVGDQVCCC
jgi:discs large protein 5